MQTALLSLHSPKAFLETRLNTEPRIFLLQAFAVFYSFTAAALRPRQTSLFEDPWMLIRMAIPALATLSVLLFRNACASPEPRKHYTSTVDVALAFGLAFLTQPLLAQFRPELLLPRGWAPTDGGFVSLMFLTGLRTWFPPQPNIQGYATPIGKSIEELRWKAEDFANEVRQWNHRGLLAAAAIAVAFSFYFILNQTPNARIGSALLIAGAVTLAYRIHKRGAPAALPSNAAVPVYVAVYARELNRQRALLRHIWFWYFGSLLPALALFLTGARVYAYFTLMYVFLAAELNLRATERLQKESADLDQWKTQSPMS